MRLVILGPQGAGKGTQSLRITEKYDIPSIATGEMFRWAISEKTEMGRAVQEYVSQGLLVPDDVTIGVVRERLREEDASDGFLLDGFPRTIAQAEALDEVLEEKGQSLDAAIVIEVPEEVSIRRLSVRRVCTRCGRNYSMEAPPQKDWACDVCGGRVERRGDDDEATIRERLKHYREWSEPLKSYYEERGTLRVIEGLGTPDEVFDRIVTAL